MHYSTRRGCERGIRVGDFDSTSRVIADAFSGGDIRGLWEVQVGPSGASTSSAINKDEEMAYASAKALTDIYQSFKRVTHFGMRCIEGIARLFSQPLEFVCDYYEGYVSPDAVFMDTPLLIDEAWEMKKAGYIHKAIGMYCVAKERARTHEEAAMAYFGIGYFLYYLGMDALSLSAFETASYYLPDRYLPHYYSALALIQLDRYEEALVKLNEAEPFLYNVDDPVSYSDFFERRAYCNLVLGNYVEALEDVLNAIELDPTNMWARKTLGGFYYYIGEYEKAISEFTYVISIDPADEVAHEIRSRIAHETQDAKTALQFFEQWMAVDDSVAYKKGLEIGGLHYELKDYKSAAIFFSNSIKWETEQPVVDREKIKELTILRGFAHLKSKKLVDAVRDLDDENLFEEGLHNCLRLFILHNLYESGQIHSDEHLWYSNHIAKMLTREMTARFVELSLPGQPLEPKDVAKYFEDHIKMVLKRIKHQKDYVPENTGYYLALARLSAGVFQYFSDYFDGTKTDWKDAIEGLERHQSIESDKLLGYFTDAVSYLCDVYTETAGSLEDEKTAYETAADTIRQMLKFTNESSPNYFRLKFLLSKAVRRIPPEDVEMRLSAVNIMEDVFKKGLPSYVKGELLEELMIERGVAWREYLEALIHQYKRLTKEKEGIKDAAEQERLAGEIDMLRPLINTAYTKSKGHLEEAACLYPQKAEVWINLLWFLYTWGKMEEDYTNAIRFGEAVLAKLEGKTLNISLSAGFKDETLARLDDKKLQISLTNRDMGELKRVIAWSMIQQADGYIARSQFGQAKELLEPALLFAKGARGKERGRTAILDTVYCIARALHLLGKVYNKNGFERNAPEDLNESAAMPVENTSATKVCKEAASYIIEDIYLKGLEYSLSEVFYALGLINAEYFNFGSVYKFCTNPLFYSYSGGRLPEYYSGLLTFIDSLEICTRPEPIKLKEVEYTYDEGVLEELLAKRIEMAEKGQIRDFGAIEDLFMALKKDTGKRDKVRQTLIKILSYQISLGRQAVFDKQNNLLLIIKLQADIVNETKDPLEIAKLKRYLTTAIAWNLHKERKVPMRQIVHQLTGLQIEQLGEQINIISKETSLP